MARCASYHTDSGSQEGGYPSLPSVVLLLHVPADQLHSRACYQTIPLNGWSAIYVDAFCDGLLTVGGDREESSARGMAGGELSVDQSPQWMRVAFSLDCAPSLTDLRREFSHLASTALAHAVQAISFEQRPPMEASRARRVTRQQYFERAGVVLSAKAYSANNRNWVIGMFADRPYILRTLTDSFSALWGKLLQQSVQENCERLVLRGTSKGLVECVRATHKWLISDFMHVIVKNDLAADWALEALAGLPLGDIDTERETHPVKVEGEAGEKREVSEIQGEGGRERVEDSRPIELAALTARILKGIVAIRANDQMKQEVQYSSASTRVNCSNSPIAAKTPLFQSLIYLLDRLVPKARHRSLRLRTRDSVISEIQSGATALRSLLLEDTLYADIFKAVEIIEGNDAVFDSWKIDFIGVTLGYGGHDLNHTREELEVLSAIATTLPGFSMTAKTDLCRWLLSKDVLQSHLNMPSRLLVAARGVLLSGDIRRVLNMTVSGIVATGEARDLEDDDELKEMGRKGRALVVYHGITQVQGLEDCSLILPFLQELCVKRLWLLMFDIAGFSDEGDGGERKVIGESGESSTERLELWVRSVRYMMGLEAFSFESVLCKEGSSDSLGWEDSRLFCVMSIVAKIVGVTGVSLKAFQLLVDIDFNSMSDLLRVTLALIFDAAVDMVVTTGFIPEVERRLGRVLTECLLQLFTVPLFITGSASKNSLLTNLLGAQRPEHLGSLDDILQFIFSLLTVNARCHILDLYLTLDKDAEKQINTLLVSEDPDSVQRVLYIPELAAYAVCSNPVESFLDSRGCPPDKCYLPPLKDEGTSLSAHTIVFRTIYLSQLTEARESPIQRSVDTFIHAHRADRLSGDVGYVSKIRTAARIAHLLNAAAHLLSHQGVKTSPFLNPNPISEAVSFAISMAPRVWSIYLLSRLSNVGVIASVVECKELLERLGMPWVSCNVTPRSDILPHQYDAQLQAVDGLTKCLTVLSYAAAMVVYRTQQLELEPTSAAVSTFLIEAERVISQGSAVEPMQHKAAAFVCMLATHEMSSALAMNVHIPAILSIYTFLRDRLDFRLKDVTVARTLLVVDAIDALPLEDRILGKKIFQDFLAAWAILKNHFRTFDICGREVQAAREIPALTSETTYVSMLVEMEGAEVHESLPAMILETKLLKLTSQVLRHNTLESLAGDELFNRHEYLTDSVRSENITCLPRHTPPQLLLTGPYGTSSRGEENLNRIAACYSTWSSHSDPPVYAHWMTREADSASTVALIKDKMARDNQMNAHRWGMVLCPGCGNRFERASGCNHITCGNHLNAYAGQNGLAPVAKGTCGMQLDAVTHRVPAPAAGKPPLKCFLIEANTQHIPASLIGLDAPKIPSVPHPTGRFEYDWTAIATHLFSTVIRSRVDLKVDKNSFAPLLLAIRDDDGSDGTLTGLTGVWGDPISNGESRDVTTALPGIGDVCTRLRLAADMVTSELVDIISRGHVTDGTYLNESETRSTLSAVSVTRHTLETSLSEAEKSGIQSSASRQEERLLDGLCDHALTLCLGMLGLIGQGFFSDLVLSKSEALSDRYRLASLSSHITPPPGGRGWSPMLKHILDEFPLGKLLAAIKCLAIAGAEGSPCSHSTLCAELPQVNKDRLNALQEQVIEAVKDITCDTSLITNELQTISSLLSGVLENVLNENINKPLLDFSVISKYVRDYPHSLGAVILDKLKVKHYGRVMQFLRQTLGHVAHNSLLAAQLSYDLEGLKGTKDGKGMKDGKQGEQGQQGEVITTTTQRKAATHPVTYRERVPDDWELFQNEKEVSTNRELNTPAPELLLQEQLARIDLEKADDEWEIVAGSYASGGEGDTPNATPSLPLSSVAPSASSSA
jgi:hypothetical protein